MLKRAMVLSGLVWTFFPSVAPAQLEYRVDDGRAETRVGIDSPTDPSHALAWLNQFVGEANKPTIAAIRVAFGTIANGTSVSVYIWSDPNQDGDPSDAGVLRSATGVVANSNSNAFNTYPITPPLDVSVGASFFVGAIINGYPGGNNPARLDKDGTDDPPSVFVPSERSWIAGDASAGGATVDPNNLAAAPVPLRTVREAFGGTPTGDGNLLVRAVEAPQQGVRVFMAPDGQQGSVPQTGNTSITMAAGTTQQVSVWVVDTAQAEQLNAHQVIVRWDGAPQAGATGAVSYVDNNPGPGNTVFVDETRSDYVFTGLLTNPPVYNETPPPPAVDAGFGWIASLFDFFQGVNPPATPSYLGEFQIEASAGAGGQFEVSFVPWGAPPAGGTNLFAPGGGLYTVDEFQNLTVTVTPSAPPPNDDCVDAIVVGNGTYAFDTTGATLGGPSHPAPCSFSDDIWYEYTATCTGTLTIDTCNPTGDTVLAIYDPGVPCTPAASNLILCNDDCATCGPGFGSMLPCPALGNPNINVATGNTYLVRVGNLSPGSGASGILSLTCTPSSGCAGQPTGTPCGNPASGPCDLPDTCNGAGVCVDNVEPNGTPCNTDPCTIDACDGAGSCVVSSFAPAGTPCSTGNVCTINDVCDGVGMCVGGSVLSCDDFDACTIDTCNPTIGCINEVIPCTSACDCLIAGATDAVCAASGQCDCSPSPSCSALCAAEWLGTPNGDFMGPANWNPSAVPNGRPAVLDNTTGSDSTAILNAGDSVNVCDVMIAGNPGALQVLQIDDTATLTTTNGTSINAHGTVTLEGGELAGSANLNTSDAKLSGWGEVSGELYNFGGTIEGRPGGLLSITGGFFQNMGVLRTIVTGAQIDVTSGMVLQDGQITINAGTTISFGTDLNNFDPGKITVEGTSATPGNLIVPSLTNNGGTVSPLTPGIDLQGGTITLDASGLITNAANRNITGYGAISRPGGLDSDNTLVNETGAVFAVQGAPGSVMSVFGRLENNGMVFIDTRTTLFLTGGLGNNWWVGGGTCIGCLTGGGEAGTLDVAGDLTMGAEAAVKMPGGRIRVTGDVDIAIDAPQRFDLATTELNLDRFFPLFGPQELELLSPNVGAVAGAPFAIGTLRIGPNQAWVTLVDNRANGSAEVGEVLYVDALILEQNVTLDTGGATVYYRTVTPADPCDPKSGVTVIGCENLIPISTGCADAADCGDLDGNAVTDDVCTWHHCDAGTCSEVAKAVPADMGGSFGACDIDGFCNVHDRNHALNCFSGTSACDELNVDAGGAFGACLPDGFCNIHDANHALTCFAGTNPCACGPSPEQPAEPYIVGSASLRVATDARSVDPGDLVTVRILLDADAVSRLHWSKPALQSYQLHLDVSGGRRGWLDLIDITIEDRGDFIFDDSAGVFDAYNVWSGQMLAGLDAGYVALLPDAYLATFTYRVSPDAVGTFVIDVAHDETDGNQTFLVGREQTDKIEITGTHPAVITVGRDRAEGTR